MFEANICGYGLLAQALIALTAPPENYFPYFTVKKYFLKIIPSEYTSALEIHNPVFCNSTWGQGKLTVLCFVGDSNKYVLF